MASALRRNMILLLFLFGTVVGSLEARQNPQAQFDRANAALNSGNYAEALSRYKKLVSQNHHSGALFLNMGIAYHHTDSLGKSKYYLLKATRFEETEKRAREALGFVDSRFSRQSAVLPQFPWDVATDWLRYNIGAENLLLGGILLLNIGILLFVSHWFFNWYPAYLRISGLSIIIVSLLLISCSFYTDYIANRYSKAVMVTEKVEIVEQPSRDAALVNQAFEGYTLTVDHHRSNSHPGWSYVRMRNGLYGWIPNSEILIL